MNTIEINNNQLKSILSDFLAVFLSTDRTNLPYSKKDITTDYACSEEYLTHMQGKKVDGFPEKTHGIDLMRFKVVDSNFKKALIQLDNNLISWSGSRNNAVKMVYPKGGYMGWHHNANASGFNILLSWSEKGMGFFRYQNPVTKEIVTMHDVPGWTCKVGYYGML